MLYPGNADAIARVAHRDTGTHCNDFPDRFVTQRAREVTGRSTVRLMHVRVIATATPSFVNVRKFPFLSSPPIHSNGLYISGSGSRA